MKRVFEDMAAAVNFAGFLATGEQCAVARGRKKTADARSGGSDAFSKVTLRHQFEFDGLFAVQLIKDIGIGLTRERANDLAHALGLQKGSDSVFAVAGVVVDERQVTGTLSDEPID